MTSIFLPDLGNQPGDGALRYGGRSMASLEAAVAALESMVQQPQNLPSTPSQSVERQRPMLVLVRDIDAGNKTVKDRAGTYLPQSPGEDGVNYRIRLNRSVFFNVYRHTINGLVGQVFRKDPVLGEDVPPAIVEHAENIDLVGTHIDVFARDLLRDALVTGHAAILVEYPQTDGTQSRAAELGPSAPIRPYWVPIRKDDIVSWRTTIENGHTLLSQLVIREVKIVPDGVFGDREQTQYRVFYRVPQGSDERVGVATGAASATVGVLVLEVTNDNRVRVLSAGSYPTQDEIPVAEITTSGTKGIFESDPPMVDLAYLNVAHYQQWSDYATSIHKTCVPIYVETGVDPEPPGSVTPVVLGPNAARRFVNPQARAEYVSHDGQALGACKMALDDLKADMATLGLAMLAPQKRAAETAEAKRLDKSTEDSALATTARGLQDGLERALGFHARYLGLESGGSVDVNREFDEQSMAADMLNAWTNAVKEVGIPSRFMLKDMQAGGLIEASENLALVEAEMEANRIAAEEQARQLEEDKLSMQREALMLKAGANGNGNAGRGESQASDQEE